MKNLEGTKAEEEIKSSKKRDVKAGLKKVEDKVEIQPDTSGIEFYRQILF